MVQTLNAMLAAVRALQAQNRETAVFSKSYVYALDNMEKALTKRLLALGAVEWVDDSVTDALKPEVL